MTASGLDPAASGDLEPWLGRWQRADRAVAVCEAAVGEGIPGYRERLAWWLARRDADVERIVVFTDAARTAHVWSWWELRGLVELRIPGREASLESAIVAGTSGVSCPPVDEAIAAAVLGALASGGPRRMPWPGELAAATAWIRSRPDASSLRAIWRSLVGFRALDVGVDPGAGWLLAVAAVLERLYLATLDRARSLVDDGAAQAGRPPHHLRDLRWRVEWWEDRSWGGDPFMPVRWNVLAHNLFGVGASADVERASDRLAAYAGVSGAMPAITHFSDEPSLTNGPPRPARRPDTPPTRIAVDLEVMVRASSALRDAWLSRRYGGRELGSAMRGLEKRRADILEDLASDGSGSAFARWTCAFPAAPEGTFDLVRETDDGR